MKPAFLRRLLAPWNKKGVGYAVGGLGETLPDIAVNGRDAYNKNGFLATCINARARAVASVPLKIYTEVVVDGEAERKEVVTGELVDLLNRPSPHMTGGMFWQSHMMEYVLMGNAPWFIVRNGKKTISLIRANKFKVNWNADETEIINYERQLKTGWTDVDKDDIVHFRTPNPYSEGMGLAISEILVRPILTAYYIDEWNRRFFKQGAIPAGLLKSDQSISSDTATLLKERWENTYQGKDNWHRIAVIGHGASFERITEPHKDMAFEALFRASREEIMAVTGVPPAIAGVMEYANYANAESQITLFWELTVLHDLHYIESVINEILIPREFPGNYFVQFDTSVIPQLQPDQDKEALRDQIYVKLGVFTPNEVRARKNLKPVAWGDEPLAAAPSPFTMGDEPPAMFRSLIKVPDPAREQRIATWRAFDKKLQMRESVMRGVMRKFFTEQGKAIRKAFDEQAKTVLPPMRFQLTSAIGRDNPILREPLKPIDIEAILLLLIITMQELKLPQLTQTTIEMILGKAGTEALKQVGAVDVVFDIANPAVVEWVEQKSLGLVTSINQTSHDQLKAILLQGIEEGQTPQTISQNIGKLFDGWRDYRSDRIARTETISAHNRGALDGYRQSDLVEGKEWLTAPGAENPRHELVAGLDGQIVSLDESFDVEGYPMQYPGDPAGPAEHVINCRCTHLPVMKEQG